MNQTQDATIALTAPAAAERLVVTAMKAKLPPPTAVVLPGLKPNHPSHKINTPKAANGML